METSITFVMLTSLYKFRSSLHPHKLKHTKLPCPSPTHRDCSNSYPLNQWCHPNISSSVIHHPLYLLPSICPSIRVFFNESVLWFRCPKYWTFSISPSNEYSGIISFRINWFDLAPQFKSINSLVLSFPYGPTLTSIQDYWENHSFD